jgi:hypothetical protein
MRCMAVPRPPRSTKKPWPDWVEWRPNQLWCWDASHFSACVAAPIVYGIVDIVSRRWIASLLCAEATRTQVKVVFLAGLEAEGLLAGLEWRLDRPDGVDVDEPPPRSCSPSPTTGQRCAPGRPERSWRCSPSGNRTASSTPGCWASTRQRSLLPPVEETFPSTGGARWEAFWMTHLPPRCPVLPCPAAEPPQVGAHLAVVGQPGAGCTLGEHPRLDDVASGRLVRSAGGRSGGQG